MRFPAALALIVVCVTLAWTQTAPKPGATPDPKKDLIFSCPMDHNIRSNGPGVCPKCGMKLVQGIPDPIEYHMDLIATPRPLKPLQPVHLRFDVHDPWKEAPVTKFTFVHEKLFHAFIVSRDLQFFVHDHPVWQDNAFHYDITFPKPGMYRILGDFYPEAATPQLIASTLIVPGPEPPVTPLARDYSPKNTENLHVELSTSPAQPVAGMLTQLRFKLNPVDGFEKYLGAWGHMLAASDDLIDLMHTHPALADGSSEVQFNLVFPREHFYRIWVQFQRNGVVNTAHFDIPVSKSPR